MKLLILLLSIVLFFTHAVADEMESKSVEALEEDSVDYFYDGYKRKIETVIYKLTEKDPTMLNMKHYKTIKGKGYSADYFIDKDKRLYISSMHFDASAIHPEDRDKKKLLTRLGIDPNEPASKLTVYMKLKILWFTFDGNRLKSVDMQVGGDED